VFPAEEVMAVSRAPGGRVYIIEPTKEQMARTNGRAAGKVMLFYPERPGATLSVRLPVSQAGDYRVEGRHVYGAWFQGRYGLYRVRADGVSLPGKFHGWYGPDGAPKHWPRARTHLVDRNWGAVHLRPPFVDLTFHSNDAGLFGISRLMLAPVEDSKLQPEDRARRVPDRRVDESPARAGPSYCQVDDAGDLKWVVPVAPGKIAIDGEFQDWDFSKPAVVANADAIDRKRLGWKAPGPQGDGDLSAEVQLAWDSEQLYLAARVTDDQLAGTVGQPRWGSPWQHDSVVLVVAPPSWLTTGPRAVGAVPERMYLGLSFYSPDTGPRPLPKGVGYKATATERGYAIEAAVAFETLGFRPAVGDRVPMMLILSDVDPQKPSGRRFDQYGLPTRGSSARQMAQLRLLHADGWGGDVQFANATIQAGQHCPFVGTIDVVSGPIQQVTLEVAPKDGGEAVRRVSSAKRLTVGRRYRITGAVQLPGELPPGRYTVRMVVR